MDVAVIAPRICLSYVIVLFEASTNDRLLRPRRDTYPLLVRSVEQLSDWAFSSSTI